jgi:(S)-2-hydroxyglutarate dehydrogenase
VALKESDYLIIGGGIMGLAIAYTLRGRYPTASIILIEKEDNVGAHASGRNSGVLHAGFYYSADSLKARFCRNGNAAMKAYAKSHGLKLNECGKVVVALDDAECEMLHELKSRGDANGVDVSIINEKTLADIEPNARTHREALHSPTTAVVDPLEVCLSLAETLKDNNVEIWLNHSYQRRIDEQTVQAGDQRICARKIINCAGLYADRIAKDFGFGKDYTIIPFKGIYLTWQGNGQPVKGCVYSVPNLKNPFLGVHFGVRVDGTTRIGPTAIPAFWRENYYGFDKFRPDELAAIVAWEAKLFATNAFGFRSLALTEMRKYSRAHMAAMAGRMVQNVDMKKFSQWSRPGIRAQLLNTRMLQLVQDFLVEGDGASVHVLNANSPAFTSSFPFAQWVVDTYI